MPDPRNTGKFLDEHPSEVSGLSEGIEVDERAEFQPKEFGIKDDMADDGEESVGFESEHIPHDVWEGVARKLAIAESPEEIKAAFSLAIPITAPEETKHAPTAAYLVCPSCGHGEADQYDDHGGLCVCKSCGVTFDPAAMV